MNGNILMNLINAYYAKHRNEDNDATAGIRKQITSNIEGILEGIQYYGLKLEDTSVYRPEDNQTSFSDFVMIAVGDYSYAENVEIIHYLYICAPSDNRGISMIDVGGVCPENLFIKYKKNDRYEDEEIAEFPVIFKPLKHDKDFYDTVMWFVNECRRRTPGELIKYADIRNIAAFSGLRNLAAKNPTYHGDVVKYFDQLKAEPLTHDPAAVKAEKERRLAEKRAKGELIAEPLIRSNKPNAATDAVVKPTSTVGKCRRCMGKLNGNICSDCGMKQ